MRTTFNRYILYLICLLGLLSYHNIALAAEGCCKIDNIPDNGITSYIKTTQEQCDYYNNQSKQSTFYAGQVVSSDNKSCIDPAPPAPSGPSKITPPVLSVSIPGFGKFSDVTCDDPTVPCSIPWLAEYIKAIFNYGLLIVGILSVIVMMVGGIMRVTAAGNREQISHANTFITSSILGATLAFCSYMILFLLNPNLTILKPIQLSYISRQELDDITEPVPLAEIQSNPDIGKIDLNSNQWIPVPNDRTGLGIWTEQSERSSVASVEALKKAADCYRKKGTNYSIRIADASRSQAEQENLYNRNCRSGKCNPATCNPYGGRCPHTSGTAFDAWACGGSNCRDKNLQLIFQQCALEAGFCILSSECWHIEYPHFSSACGSEKHYRGKYCY